MVDNYHGDARLVPLIPAFALVQPVLSRRLITRPGLPYIVDATEGLDDRLHGRALAVASAFAGPTRKLAYAALLASLSSNVRC